ncbi:hypothetical protein HWD94_03830 [Pseudarthrobacter equi]|uniref:helix-turn-helix domain-containing protein n=1 Tax=Pseudarthrobacter equi TaxID=728066 RepID=UPI0021C21F7D|nr:helix-turn-helix domain-containing protein [Pseudarthrobacter equi]MCT9624253.1 hypothetical protein [Pseudarthrobacter equi]
MVTAARMDRGASTVGSRGHTASAEPCNFDAIEDADQLAAVLRGWAEQLAVVGPQFSPPRIAERLLNQVKQIRGQEWAGDLLRELGHALGAARRATDRGAARVFAGMCPTEDEDGAPCGTAVFTMPGRSMARCRKCRSEWDASEWRARALEYAGVHEGTPAELSRMLSDPVTGEALPQGTIRQWVRRGKLSPVGKNAGGKPVYRVREVRDLWIRMKSSSFGNPTLKAGEAA